MNQTTEPAASAEPTCSPFFVFDVESIGLHGQAFAVAGGVYIDGAAQYEFSYSCPQEEALGTAQDRAWVKANVPVLEITNRLPIGIRDAFWHEWEKAKKRYPGITMAAECLWPVEARFMASCVDDNPEYFGFNGPYPFHEIASIMLAAGMDPMATYDREPSEMPKHNPLADARQSARLLTMALRMLENAEASRPAAHNPENPKP